MRALVRSAVAVALMLPAPALAHGDHAAEIPGWTWDAWITVPLVLSAAIFALGFVRLAARSTRAALRPRAILFGLGWVTLALALVSPLHQAGERSFAAHMFEHELIMLLAAPLLVAAEPMVLMLWAFPAAGRRAIGGIVNARPIAASWRGLSGPVTATIVQATALWLWHAPALFDLALASEAWHAVQHLSFLISALLFWTAMLGKRRNRHAGERGLAALCLFLTSLISGALGALMAFSQSPWYQGYARLGMAPFGLSPAEDQQLAGLIMWIPGGLVHAGAALVIIAALVRRPSPGQVAHAL
jgi:putative membrane protein